MSFHKQRQSMLPEGKALSGVFSLTNAKSLDSS